MNRFFWSIASALVLSGAAFAQFPGSQPIFPQQYSPNPNQPSPMVLQNYYNRGTQPLSPYLNLVRGTGQLGVDYYFGVRPGLPSGGQPLSQQAPRGMALANSQMKTGYIPQAGAQTSEPLPLPDPGQDVVLPPSGHGVAYGNVFGISRPGMAGAGSSAASRGGYFTAPSVGTQRRPTAPTSKK